MVDDEASIEGAVNRYLFRTESDTDQDDDDDILGQNSLFTDTHENQPVDVFVERQIMNVLLAEQHVGGSIAQRLWPAAQYLADFVSAHYDCDRLSNTVIVIYASHVDWSFLYCWSRCTWINFHGS